MTTDLFKYLILFTKPVIWLFVIVFLCFIPAEDLPETKLMNIPYFDKWIHFGMYFIFAVLLARPLKTVETPFWIFALAISILVGGIIEILQYFITNSRSASWGDFSADIVGSVAGLLAFGWIVEGRRWERFI